MLAECELRLDFGENLYRLNECENPRESQLRRQADSAINRLRFIQISPRAALGQGRQNERIAVVQMRMATLAGLSQCHEINKFSQICLPAAAT